MDAVLRRKQEKKIFECRPSIAFFVKIFKVQMRPNTIEKIKI